MSPKRVKVGEEAPTFSMKSYNKGNIDLQQILKENPNKKLVLIFSRYFGCPICQLDTQEVLNVKEDIREKNGMILLVTQSGSEIAEKKIKELGIDFPVIPSTPEELYADYGLGLMTLSTTIQIPKRLIKAKKAGFEHGAYEGKESQCPGQFIINSSGKVIHAKKGWFDPESLLRDLEQ